MKLFIISNRLPVKVKNDNGEISFQRSEGGLATGLNSLSTSYEKHWIGWPGICTSNTQELEEITNSLNKLNFHPVFLSETQIKDYYEGYSNSTIWPLCHYFFAYTEYKQRFWEAYKEVNQLFLQEILRQVGPDDKVWIQDYQLMLLPGMLRKAAPKLSIGYFHHIPFPSYELFRILPERAELLQGLLGADFIAFHTHDYMRHFISAAERVLKLSFKLNEVQIGNRIVSIDALPMGINYNLYHEAPQKEEVRKCIEQTRQRIGKHKLILSVDRLDYSKGILHRLHGFASFLEHHPEYYEKVTLAMVIVPSRDHVDSYAELKTRINEEIGSINGTYSTINWTPVCYFYHALSFEELAAMYHLADIALITPLRDGMNLVAKEFVATRTDNAGVLILSEMAGAAVELNQALLINPNDTAQIETAIHQALTMQEDERKARMQKMQQAVATNTVNKWANDFMRNWEETCAKSRELQAKCMTKYIEQSIKAQYDKAKQRLILLDYDGTLAPICQRPEDAAPTIHIIGTLLHLANDQNNTVVVNSGRDHFTLEKWLGELPIKLAAEHGAYHKEDGVWHNTIIRKEWNTGLLKILQHFVNKTPHAHLEVKDTALAWHYRECDVWLGNMRAQQLINNIVSICLRDKLQIIQGDKVIEIKLPDCNKGTEVARYTDKKHYDFILAIGDDTTDEDMFKALPKNAVSIKVGNASAVATHNMLSQSEVLPFLQFLCGNPQKQNVATITVHHWKSLFRNITKWFH